MNRLTTRNSMGVAALKIPYQCERCGEETYRLADYGNGEPIEKLAEYEDLEEQRRLLKLPCAVGDTVYRIFPNDLEDRVLGQTVLGFSNEAMLLYNDFIWTPFDKIGKTVFLTKEEAEAVLKELTDKRG